MARKFYLITDIYEHAALDVTSSPQAWASFLRSACRNFRLRFDEQLLIYAQRPDATAVLEIERWNELYGRWVNRGAHGIAVFEDADRSSQRLIHYFDISDTHGSRFARPVHIWEMKEEYAKEVADSLADSFGELDDGSSFLAAVLSAAKNAVEDNISDYLADFTEIARGTGLAAYPDDARGIYEDLVLSSASYMMLSRLGIDASEIIPDDRFSWIGLFNSQSLAVALGVAVSDISGMLLSDVARTVRDAERRDRIIAQPAEKEYDQNRISERSENENDEDNVHEDGRLRAARSDAAEGAADGSRSVREDAEEVSERAPQDTVLRASYELQAEGASDGDRAESDGDGRFSRSQDGEGRGRDGEHEGDRHDDLGPYDEQHQEQSEGDGPLGGGLRLDFYDRRHEDRSLPFFGDTATINEMLRTTPHLKATREEIREFFEREPDENARTEYIRSIFNNDYTEVILGDGRRVGYKTYQNVLHMWEGAYLSRTSQSFYDWGVIAAHFDGMRLLGELYDTVKPLPSVDGQLGIIENAANEAEAKSSAFALPQEIVDRVLTRGSGVFEGKFRIYEQFQKSLSSNENVAFLKNEYGIGGAGPVITAPISTRVTTAKAYDCRAGTARTNTA